MHVKRADRVGVLVQREISDLLLTKIKDPRLDLVTITQVRISDNLQSARIYFCAAGGDERKESVLAGFHSAVGYLKRELGCRLELRNVPELKFIYDESFDRAAALNEVFETMHNETK